jgi:hypothetical protein
LYSVSSVKNKNKTISDFQSQFSTSKIIRIFQKKISLKNIIFGAQFLLLIFLKNFNFQATLFSKMTSNFYSTDRKTQKLFKGLVVGFGPKGMPG